MSKTKSYQKRSPEERASQSERQGGLNEAAGGMEAQRNLARLKSEDQRKTRQAKRPNR
jgi:hypothetical protein